MEIIIGDKSGFCAGVSYTIKKAEELLDKYKTIYCLGEIVHNEKVVKSLEDKGMITVESIDEIPDGSRAIFRAHGEARNVYEKAKTKDLEIIDLTCGKIKVIHSKIEKNNDFFMIILGKKDHPETIGHYGFVDDGIVVSDIDEIDEAFRAYRNSNKKKVYLFAQTTFNEILFQKMVNKISEVLGEELIVDNTLCAATRERQDAVIELAKKVDVVIVVGGKNSSNTKELFNIANDNCKRAILIQDVNDLKNEVITEEKVGIMAGASTPEVVVKEIVDYLEGL